MVPLGISSPGPLRLLCLGAHCDDIEIGCGGTLARLIADHPGTEVTWVVFSSTPEREKETRAAARSLLAGAAGSKLMVHQFRDGFFPTVAADIKEVLERLKSEVTPDVVLTHRLRDAHQDHRLIAELTWNTFRDHTILEYEIPKYDGDLSHPNLYVPLEESTVALKVKVLMDCFPSQHRRAWFDEETFRALLRLRGVECNAPDRYAEAFHARKLVW